MSQWFLSRFEVGDLIFQTAEHWMMYQKAQLFKNYNLAENILNSNNPKEVKNMGRDVIGFELSLWEKYKCQIVKIGNIHKFNHNGNT